MNNTLLSLQAPLIFLNHFISTLPSWFGREGKSTSPAMEAVPSHCEPHSHQAATLTSSSSLPNLLLIWAWMKWGKWFVFVPCTENPGGAYITLQLWKLSSGCRVLSNFGSGPSTFSGATKMSHSSASTQLFPPKYTSHKSTPLCSVANTPFGKGVQSLFL